MLYLSPRAGRGRIATAIRVRGPRRESERLEMGSEAQTRETAPSPRPSYALGLGVDAKNRDVIQDLDEDSL